jgi:L-threonylcarbamoyladenylate synthase
LVYFYHTLEDNTTINTTSLANPKIINYLRRGQIGVLPTDTICGLHTSVFHPHSVERLYKLRKRDPQKPFIILISSLTDLALFQVKLDQKSLSILKKYWPGKVSVILPCPKDSFKYLHRGTKTLAFRLPKNKDLLELLRQTGPLVSTSTNPEGAPPAQSIEQAEKYFGNQIDFYVNAGPLASPPSTLITIKSGKIKVIRQGSVKI